MIPKTDITKIQVYGPAVEVAYFRGMILQKAAHYFPLLDQWCPPIYINVKPPWGTDGEERPHADPRYIYLPLVDVVPDYRDYHLGMENFYHEAAHAFEMKIMGRSMAECDQEFAYAVENAVKKEDSLVYVLLTAMMKQYGYIK